jgi:hypothetical protein
MNPRLVITALTLLASPLAAAQNVSEDPAPDPVLDAIQDFSKRDQEAPAESTTAPVKTESATTEPAVPVLVTGKPPEEAAAAVPAPIQQDAVATAPDEVAPEPENGLTVRIEKLQTGQGSADPSKVKLLAPFPAKPLAPAPPGWRLDTSDGAPAFTREVELSPGSKITLNIRPHVLVPDANGTNVFTIAEPGYDSSLGYQQNSTVGAILSNSIRQLDEESKQLGTAIENLQQLLVSLPKPEPQAVETAAKPPTSRKK